MKYHQSRENRQPSNSNEINESIKKHSLLLPYLDERETSIMKTSSKELRRILPENIKMEVIYTGTKLGSQFSIKDPIPKTHNYDIIYHTVCSEDNCNENYIDKCARSLKERTKDHNSRDKNSHVLRQSIESRYKEVAVSDFQIIGKGYFHHNGRKKT